MTITDAQFINDVERYDAFIEKFIDPSYGIIALNHGYDLETARKAGLLKEPYASDLNPAEIEQAVEARSCIEFINQFKSSETGVIALKWGYTIEDALKANLLK